MSFFKPCPICGAELTAKNLRYQDDWGTLIGELEDMVDPADPKAPANVEAVMGARFDKAEWKSMPLGRPALEEEEIE